MKFYSNNGKRTSFREFVDRFFLFTNKRVALERGWGTQDYLIGTALGVTFLLGIYGAYKMGLIGGNANTVGANFTEIQAAIHQVAPTGNYTGLTNSILIQSGAIPTNIATDSSGTMYGPTTAAGTQGVYTVTGSTGLATITLTPVDASVCAQTVAQLMSGGNWVTINGANVATVLSSGTSVSVEANSLCPAGSGDTITAITN